MGEVKTGSNLQFLDLTPSDAPDRPVVLVVDDDRTVLDVACRLLMSAGCAVLPARNGEEALRQYHSHADEIHLALVDLTMPRMSGEVLIRELRQISTDLPIVVMTGHSEQDVLPCFTDLSVAGYLLKPFRLPALIEVMDRILGTRMRGGRPQTLSV